VEAQTPDGKSEKLKAELLLVATGRGPVTSGLGAEEAGIKMERGYIKVTSSIERRCPTCRQSAT
jgi:dihydrolipoamide dehydrogenase